MSILLSINKNQKKYRFWSTIVDDWLTDWLPENKAKDYLSNNLDNSYVNNCNRLKDGLRDVPKQLFLNHVNYLKAKMTINSTAYKSYNTQPDYSNTMYTPLKSQIDSLANNIYGVDDNLLSTENSSLEKQLSDINSEATSYFLSK